jgi:hypothetical protein
MVVVVVVVVLVVAMWSPSFVVVVAKARGSLFFGLVLVLVLFTLVVVLLIVLIVLPILPIPHIHHCRSKPISIISHPISIPVVCGVIIPLLSDPPRLCISVPPSQCHCCHCHPPAPCRRAVVVVVAPRCCCCWFVVHPPPSMVRHSRPFVPRIPVPIPIPVSCLSIVVPYSVAHGGGLSLLVGRSSSVGRCGCVGWVVASL